MFRFFYQTGRLPVLLLFCWLSGNSTALAQKYDTLAFPASWEGNWVGKLNIYGEKGIRQSVDMQLEIHKIDTSLTGRYTFGLIYGSRDKDWRPYELVPVSPEKGLWKVDEKNSIVMESYLLGPKLLCWFVVQNSRILCTYEKTSDQTMVFEVFAGTEAPVSTTGNTKQESEEIPEVKTYPFGGFQRAVLIKQGTGPDPLKKEHKE